MVACNTCGEEVKGSDEAIAKLLATLKEHPEIPQNVHLIVTCIKCEGKTPGG